MGKLNIAHHKSYHPYNRDNIERVKRDEALADLAASDKSQRSLAADSEARLTLLREQAAAEKKKAKSRGPSDAEKKLEKQLKGKGKAQQHDDGDEADEEGGSTILHPPEASGSLRVRDEPALATPTTHPNFWASLESHAPNNALAPNPSRAKMEKTAQEKWEDSLTMYLGKPAQELRPWYSDAELKSGQERKRTEDEVLERSYKDTESKRITDPLAQVNSYLAIRDALHSHSTSSSRRFAESPKPPNLEAFKVPLLAPKRRRERKASQSPPPPRRTNVAEKPSLPRKRASNSGSDSDDAFLPTLPPSLSKPAQPTNVIAVSQPKILKPDISAERSRAEALLRQHQSSRECGGSSRYSSVANTPAASERGEGRLFNASEVREAQERRRVGHGIDGEREYRAGNSPKKRRRYD